MLPLAVALLGSPQGKNRLTQLGRQVLGSREELSRLPRVLRSSGAGLGVVQDRGECPGDGAGLRGDEDGSSPGGDGGAADVATIATPARSAS